MSRERPINLNLFKFHFPVMAIVSILHRITGVILFLSIPLLLYVLHQSLVSQEAFSSIKVVIDHPFFKIVLIAILASAVYHLLAGIRHLVMDCGIGESLMSGRITAWASIVLTIIVVVWMGVWLW